MTTPSFPREFCMAQLLLLRHGLAGSRLKGPDDHQRPLTAAGVEQTRAMVVALTGLNLRCSRAISSPLPRARQTAEIAVDLQLAADCTIDGRLAPGGDAVGLLREQIRPSEQLLLVGHEPGLGNLANWLLDADAAPVQLRKAGLARLELSAVPPGPGSAHLSLLLTPRDLLGAGSL